MPKDNLSYALLGFAVPAHKRPSATRAKTAPPLTRLPPELQLGIMQFLSPKDYLAASHSHRALWRTSFDTVAMAQQLIERGQLARTAGKTTLRPDTQQTDMRQRLVRLARIEGQYTHGPTRQDILSDTDEPVSVTQLSGDGRMALTAPLLGAATVWSIAGDKRRAISRLGGDFDTFDIACFSDDNAFVVTTSDDAQTRVWDLSKAKPRASILGGHTDTVDAFCISPDSQYILTASRDMTARMWQITGATPGCLHTLHHPEPLVSALFYNDGAFVVTQSATQEFLWEIGALPTLLAQAPVPQPTAPVTEPPASWHMMLSRERMLSLDAMGDAHLCDTSFTPPKCLTFVGHTKGIQCATESYDGRYLLTGAEDNTAILWDLTSTAKLTTLVGHTNAVRDVDISDDGSLVMTGSEDGTTRLWDFMPRRQRPWGLWRSYVRTASTSLLSLRVGGLRQTRRTSR